MKHSRLFGRLALGCGLCVVFVAVVLVAGFFWLTSESGARWLTTGPTDLKVAVIAPEVIDRGEHFTLTATVTNQSNRPRILNRVDIGQGYLDGVVVKSSEPRFRDATLIELPARVAYSFAHTVPANGRLEVRFGLYAAHAGDHSDEVLFFFDRDVRPLGYPIRILINEP